MAPTVSSAMTMRGIFDRNIDSRKHITGNFDPRNPLPKSATWAEWRRNMTSSLDAAAQAMREAMRETVKRHSLWYLGQGGLMILTGILALVYPVISSFALVS